MWKFYVYELHDASGVQYVGKGSGRRLAVQECRYGLQGREVARFKRERDAYAFEVAQIAATRPALNKHRGGNGSRATPVRELRCPSPQHIARFLLQRFRGLIARSKVEALRRVAHG